MRISRHLQTWESVDSIYFNLAEKYRSLLSIRYSSLWIESITLDNYESYIGSTSFQRLHIYLWNMQQCRKIPGRTTSHIGKVQNRNYQMRREYIEARRSGR